MPGALDSKVHQEWYLQKMVERQAADVPPVNREGGGTRIWAAVCDSDGFLARSWEVFEVYG